MTAQRNHACHPMPSSCPLHVPLPLPAQAEEMAQRTPLPPAGPGQAAVEVVAGSFAWAAGDAPLLHDIDLAGRPRGWLSIVARLLDRAGPGACALPV